MSLEATVWALKKAPVPSGDPIAHLVLIGLADHADVHGRDAFPSVSTLAEYARCSKRSVQNKLAVLEEAGVIWRGDQVAASRYPANRRPVVYDLAMEARIEVPEPVDNSISGVQDVHACAVGEDSGVHENGVRGAQDDTLGVHAGADKPYIKPSLNQEGDYVRNQTGETEPVDNSPSQDSEGDVPAADAAEPATGGPVTVPAFHAPIIMDEVPSARGLSPVCEAHQRVVAPPPCGACQKAREAWEAESLRKARERETERRARERSEAKSRRERVEAAKADPAVRAYNEQIRAGIRAKFGRKVS